MPVSVGNLHRFQHRTELLQHQLHPYPAIIVDGHIAVGDLHQGTVVVSGDLRHHAKHFAVRWEQPCVAPPVTVQINLQARRRDPGNGPPTMVGFQSDGERTSLIV